MDAGRGPRATLKASGGRPEIFTFFRPQPLEKARFAKINVSKKSKFAPA